MAAASSEVIALIADMTALLQDDSEDAEQAGQVNLMKQKLAELQQDQVEGAKESIAGRLLGRCRLATRGCSFLITQRRLEVETAWFVVFYFFSCHPPLPPPTDMHSQIAKLREKVKNPQEVEIALDRERLFQRRQDLEQELQQMLVRLCGAVRHGIHPNNRPLIPLPPPPFPECAGSTPSSRTTIG